MSKEINQIFGISEQSIAERAYAKFEQRGYTHGFDVQDWLGAETEIAQEKMNETFPIPEITEFIVGDGSGQED